jgi:hypothetical protein
MIKKLGKTGGGGCKRANFDVSFLILFIFLFPFHISIYTPQ